MESALSAGVVENANCTSAEGYKPPLSQRGYMLTMSDNL